MNTRPWTVVTLIVATLAGGVRPALADETAALTTEIQTMDANAATKGSGAVTGKIAGDFESFAGSKENATALVTGLRNGWEITLTQQGEPSATLTPPTKPMGYGNVSTSLSLAKYQLAQQGITNPTPEQLKIALNGGTIAVDGNTVDYQGVLQMRADGMGWGQIAQQLGTKLGPVVSGIKSQNARMATLPAEENTTTTSGSTSATSAASSAPSSSQSRGSSSNGKGITSAAGGSVPGLGKGNESGKVSTAGGGASAPGRGIVSASGQAGGPAAHGQARGHGVVTAGGAAAAGGGSAAPRSGNGKALGHAK
jgi:antitoxin (DNA-binding transcriptional repressor) of toxin-antitoxin stability system